MGLTVILILTEFSKDFKINIDILYNVLKKT